MSEKLEVPQGEMTNEIWWEWSALVRDQECAVCGGQLSIRTVPERAAMAVGCPLHEKGGFRQRTTYTEDYRRGGEVHPAIRDNIEQKMMTGTEFNRAVQLLALRFPDSIKDRAGAALFIYDCIRLGLDPLIQPAEAVPVAFKTKDKAGREKYTVAMITTEDGALSMAARGCPDEYDGAPTTMPILTYLMREYETRPLEELEKMASHIAEDLCGDKAAYVWVALGKRRSATEINPVYGYFTQAEKKRAMDKKLPAGTQPGNQARVRAIKHWVRETYPEARQKMLEYTAELARRSEGAKEAQEIIDTEYRFLDTPDKKPSLISPPGQKAAGAPKPARTTRAKKADNKVGEPAQRTPGPGQGKEAGGKTAAEPSGAGENTLVSATDSDEMAPARSASAAAGGATLKINWDELREYLSLIKWSDNTCLSWFGLEAGGDFQSILPTLPRDKVERFIREVQERASKVQRTLFN